MPKQMDLLAVNQTWRIDYVHSQTKLQIIPRPHQELAILGNIKNKNHCIELLMHWLKNHAKNHLLMELDKISEELNMPYSRASVRDQKTRWGSCSREKAISLNCKLMFFPENLVRHVLIHELCHTVHLNHSTHFWQLVAKHDINFKEHRHEVRNAKKYLPTWLRT